MVITSCPGFDSLQLILLCFSLFMMFDTDYNYLWFDYHLDYSFKVLIFKVQLETSLNKWLSYIHSDSTPLLIVGYSSLCNQLACYIEVSYSSLFLSNS